MGIKNIVLHLPRYLRSLRGRKMFRALDDICLDIHKGESFGIIGRNGSGKSTMLGLIAGVIRSSSGSVHAAGAIGMLLELGAGFHRELNGMENILLNGVLLGMTRRQVQEQMESIIDFSELREFIYQPVRGYSTGMLARLGFAVAVHLDPDILLVDEVLAVGDEEFQEKCLQRIEQLRAAGKTIVFVSHNLAMVERACDRVALIDHGRLVDVGPAKPITEEYLRLVHATQG